MKRSSAIISLVLALLSTFDFAYADPPRPAAEVSICESAALPDDPRITLLLFIQGQRINVAAMTEGVRPEAKDRLRQIIHNGRWKELIALFEQNPTRTETVRAAFGLLLDQRLTLENFVTLNLLWEFFENHRANGTVEVQVRPLLDENGQLTEFALRQFSIENSPDYQGYIASFPGRPFSTTGLSYFQSHELDRLREELARLNPLERVAFEVRTPNFVGARESLTYSNTMSSGLDLPRQRRNYDEGGYELNLLSFGTLQATLNARFGERAVRLFPQFGISSDEDFFNALEHDGRVFALSFPDLRHEETADSVSMGLYFVSVHDMYHAFLASQYDPHYRRILGQLHRLAPQAHVGPKVIYDFAGADAFRGSAPSSAQSIAIEFRGHLPVILSDLAQNPEYYRARGVDPEALARDLREAAARE